MQILIAQPAPGMHKNFMDGQFHLMLPIGAAFLQRAKSCGRNTAAHIFQLNKTDHLKTITTIIRSG